MSPVFSHGRLRLYLLKLLEESPRHGYDVIRLLEDRFMGLYAPSPGTIYPRLQRLEASEDDLIELGQILFRALFQGKITEIYTRAQGRLQDQQGRPRFHLDRMLLGSVVIRHVGFAGREATSNQSDTQDCNDQMTRHDTTLPSE